MKIKKIPIIACLIVLSLVFALFSGCVAVGNDESSVNGTYKLAEGSENKTYSSLTLENGEWTAKSADKSINGTFTINSDKLSFYESDEDGKQTLCAYAFLKSSEWLRVYPVTETRITCDFTKSGAAPSGVKTDTTNLTYKLSENGEYYFVTSADGSSGEVIVPSEYNGKPVKGIAKLAFYRCLKVVRVVLPDTVEKINEEAFRGCESLYAVYPGKNLSLISEKAFYGCSVLRFFPSASVKTIAKQAFFGADMSGFSVPDTVEYIGEEAFSFANIVSVEIPAATSYIGTRAFANCADIDEISVDENNATYSSYGEHCIVDKAQGLLLAGCSKTTLPTGGKVKIIGEGAMSGLSDLTSIVFPAEITEIRRGGFEDCKVIESIYYLGTSPKDWLAIQKTSNNVKFFRANVYIYSENEPEINEKKDGYAPKDGYNCTFWRYVGGKPALWRFTEEHPPAKNQK